MSGQALRAGVAHGALSTDLTPAQVAQVASGLIGAAQALGNASGAGALHTGAAVLTSAATALSAAGAADPKLAQAADVVTQIATCASTVASAVESGVSLPLALAQTALNFVPPGPLADMAGALLAAVAYAGSGVNSDLSAAQGLLGTLAGQALGLAAKYVDLLPPGLAELAREFVLPVLGQIVSGSAAGFDPGALLHAGVDLAFNAVLAGAPLPVQTAASAARALIRGEDAPAVLRRTLTQLGGPA